MPQKRRQSHKDESSSSSSSFSTTNPPPPIAASVSTPKFDRQILFNLQPRKTPIWISYKDQDEFMLNITRLHSKTWDAMLFPDVRLMDDFAADVKQLREYYRCHICGDLVSDNALLPIDKSLKHGTVCRECLVNNRCRCIHKDCKLTLIGFNDDPRFSIMVKSYKQFCAMFLLNKECQKMLELRLMEDETFDAIGLIIFLREGAFTGKKCLKKSIILTEPDLDEIGDPPKPEVVRKNGVREANLFPNAELEIVPRSANNSNRLVAVVKTPSPKKRSAPVINLEPTNQWPDTTQPFTYNSGTPACSNQSLDGNINLSSNSYFNLSSPPGTSTGSSELPIVTKKPRSPAKKEEQPKSGNKGCRCGIAAANPGKLTCCGQRCPCYVEGKGCFDCKCKGCRNPHLPGGKKLLQGINAVIDTRTNETVPLHFPYITTQFYSNSNGQLMQPVFPLAASVASFNSYGIPVISVSPINYQQQTPQ